MVHMEDGIEFSLSFVTDEAGMRAVIHRLLSNIAVQSADDPKINPYRRARIEREAEAAGDPATPIDHLIGQLDIFDEQYFWALSPDTPLVRYGKTAHSHAYRRDGLYALALGMRLREGIPEEAYYRFIDCIGTGHDGGLKAAAVLFATRGRRWKANNVVDWLDFCNGRIPSYARELSKTQECYSRVELFNEMRSLVGGMWVADPEPADLAVAAALCHWPRFLCDFCRSDFDNYAAVAIEGPRGGGYLVCSAECYREMLRYKFDVHSGAEFEDLELDEETMAKLEALSETSVDAHVQRGSNDPKALLAKHMDRLH